MEPENASPPKSNKSGKGNGQLIDQILAETKAQLSKKHKPPSEPSPLIANNKSKKRTSVQNSLISELVNQELEGLRKKRKRHSKELNENGTFLKKVKVEPVSEDEHSQSVQNEAALSLSSAKSDKKGSYRSLSRERDELERLFSHTSSVVNSTINPFASSPQRQLTDLSISRIVKEEKQSSSESEIPIPKSKKKPVSALRQVKSADETPNQTLSSFNSQRTLKDSTISTSTTVPFNRSDSSSSENESTVPVSSSPVKKLVLEDKPVKPRRSPDKSKQAETKHKKLQKRSSSKLLSITKKSNMNVSSQSQESPDSSSEEVSSPRPPVKPKRRRSSVPAPIKTRASESSSEELPPPTPIQIKQEKSKRKKHISVPTPIKTRASSASESSSEEEALPKPMQVKQENPVSVHVPIKSQPTSDSEASTVPTPSVVKRDKANKPVSVPRPIKQRVSSGSESDSEAPALPKPLQVTSKPKKRASAPASLGKVLLSGDEDGSAELSKINPGALNQAKGRKSHSCIMMESIEKSSKAKKKKSPSLVKKQDTDSSSDSEEEKPRKKASDSSTSSRSEEKSTKSSPVKANKETATESSSDEEAPSASKRKGASRENVPAPKAVVLQTKFLHVITAKGQRQETESSSSDAGPSDLDSDSGPEEKPAPKFSPLKKNPQDNNKDTSSENSSDEEASCRPSEPRKTSLTPNKAKNISPMKKNSQVNNKATSSENSSDEEASSRPSESRQTSLTPNKAKNISPMKKNPQDNNKDTSSENSSDEEASSRPSESRQTSLTPNKAKNISPMKKNSQVNNKATSSENSSDEEASSRPSESRQTSLTPNKAKNASNQNLLPPKSLSVNEAKGKKRRKQSENSVGSDEATPKKRSKAESLRDSAPEPPQKASTASKSKSPVATPKHQNVFVDSNGLAPESSDSEQESPVQTTISQKANWIESLNRSYPGLEQQHIKTSLPENSAKYSLLLVPKHINPSSLINLKCYLNKESPVSLNNMAYVFQPLPKKPDPVVLGLKTPKLLELESVIYFKQFLPKLRLDEIEVPAKEDVSLPSVIKSRHPLFGTNYKKEIRLDQGVKQNLQHAVERKEKVVLKARSKRRSKRQPTSDGVEEGVLSIFNSIQVSPGGESLTDGPEDGDVGKVSKNKNSEQGKKKRKSAKGASDAAQWAPEPVEKKKKKKRKVVDE